MESQHDIDDDPESHPGDSHHDVNHATHCGTRFLFRSDIRVHAFHGCRSHLNNSTMSLSENLLSQTTTADLCDLIFEPQRQTSNLYDLCLQNMTSDLSSLIQQTYGASRKFRMGCETFNFKL